jgi:hypothetical protein
MAASSKLMIVEAERRFPCRIKLGVDGRLWRTSDRDARLA